ncbi:hypothetical protein L3476_19710 [Paenibacillus thiaminolyticus]|uniref:hypothetical protein n=1 Tax=Paenibacillus thiaminolyticus TaxID=49283 RepID=UPI00234FCCF8|nr:hypothetical protein [Paenibacillus thiaminolyticus]WCR25548.1 hypothetical protein L3476_19710 [Paenibacillus thiaminolyticus]
MNIYFGIKYVDDFSNRHVIESILFVLEQQLGHQASCIVRDVEEWGASIFFACGVDAEDIRHHRFLGSYSY